MKNRILFRIFALLAVSAAAAVSCIDDKGNYDYLDPSQVMPVVIEGIEEEITALNLTNLKITPKMNDGDREYAYSWYVHPVSPQGAIPVKTELSTERNLDVTLRLKPNNYYLYLEVSDPARNDVSVRKRVLLHVMGSDIHKGWYVLKDDGEYTDFDYINDGENKLYPDVMANSGVSGDRLEGRALQMLYQGGWYCHRFTLEDGTYEIDQSLSAYHILTDRGLRTINGETLDLLKDYDEQFYVVPEVRAPQSISIPYEDVPDQYIVNNGKLHGILSVIPTIGKYSAAIPGFYNAHKDILSSLMGACLFFDTEERTFYYVLYLDPSLINATDNFFDPSLPSLTNMDYTLVNMMQPDGYGFMVDGYVIMQGLNDGKYYLGSINLDMMTMGMPLLNSFVQMPDGARLPLAEVKKPSPSGSFIYFGDANKLCVYRNAPGLDQQEEAMVTYPAGETVGYIYCRGTEVVVLTNSAAGWKLYGYDLVGAGNPELQPVKFTYSGSGTGRHR